MKCVTCTKCSPPITWSYRRGTSYRLSTLSGQGLTLICCSDCVCFSSHVADGDISRLAESILSLHLCLPALFGSSSCCRCTFHHSVFYLLSSHMHVRPSESGPVF